MQGIITSDGELSFGEGLPGRETTLEGVYYAMLNQQGTPWRMGSVNPRWKQHMPLTSDLGDVENAALRENGIWLERGDAPVERLAVMCCGQGAVWSGMGRELYDNFPAARAAMDRIAACANWDVLSLLDEPDVETIGLTRWQQPYLFLLEYAQWSLYLSLGLKPDLICGHSLGELIALCLSGVYSPETCWHIMDIRSRHMSDIESKSTRDTGMMAVYANQDEIAQAQAKWPVLYVSNYNTPRQFILSGPRDVLKEARREFRHRHFPAVMLNVTLAFHHPSMRVLRDLSYRRLAAFEMHAARIPMLSCITTGFYPDEQAEICGYITDLDENSVRWVECVHKMWQRDGIRHFLELGPQDTLGGLVSEIEPGALTLSSSSRGHEKEFVRRTLARLYALGHLPGRQIWAVAEASARKTPQEEASVGGTEASSPAIPPSAKEQSETALGPNGAEAVLRKLLADASGRDAESVTLQSDLRFDLSLHSSQFPRLIDRAEKELGISVSFEDLLQVATVGDLVRVFAGKAGETVSEPREETAQLGRFVRRPFLARTKAPHSSLREKPERIRECAFNPTLCRTPLQKGSIVAAYGKSDRVFSALLAGIAPSEAIFVVQDGFQETKRRLQTLGASMGTHAFGGDCLVDALKGLSRMDILILEDIFSEELSREEARAICLELVRTGCRLLVVVRSRESVSPAPSGGASLLELARKEGLRALLFVVTGNAEGHYPLELGDLLGREILCGDRDEIFLEPADNVELLAQPLVDDADASPLVYPVRNPELFRANTLLETGCQYSSDGEPALLVSEKTHDGAHLIPESFLLRAHLDAARLLLPWLEPRGFTDMRFFSRPALTPGVVREARLITDIAPQWLAHQGVSVRMCRTRMDFRGLTQNGRRTDQYGRVIDGIVIMGASSEVTLPLWQDGTAGKPESSIDAGAWYEERGIGAPFRLLSDVKQLSGGGLEASLVQQSFIALTGLWNYDSELSAIEGALQGAQMALSCVPPSEAGRECRLSTAGFIRFGRKAKRGPWKLVLRRSWDAGSIVRFDAQVTDATGNCFVTINHLEFDSLPPETPEAGINMD